MRRRKTSLALALLALLLLPVLSGCDRTQDKNKRAELAAQRKLAARNPVVVNSPNPAIKVNEVQAVGRGKQALVVVSLTNTGKQVLSDLPISVGVKRGGSSKLLNKGPNIYYFANHVPVAAPGKQTIWTGQLERRIPKGTLFAHVGVATLPQSEGRTIPSLQTSLVAHTADEVTGSLTNTSGLPQYVIELYAVSRHGGKWVAAGRSRLTKVTGDDERDFVIPMQGNAKKNAPTISAAPAVLKSPE